MADRDVFERFAEDYDRWFEERPAKYHAELARIRHFLSHPDTRSIEVGVGSGRFAGPLGIPLGLEPSIPLARIARERGVEVILGKGEAIPIRDGACPLALLVTVICFLDDPVPVFLEVRRILAPQGTLVTGLLEREGEVARKYRHDEGKHRFLSRARFYSSGESQALLEQAGFSVTEVESRAGFSVIAAERSG